jgi:hypothetical protein
MLNKSVIMKVKVEVKVESESSFPVTSISTSICCYGMDDFR